MIGFPSEAFLFLILGLSLFFSFYLLFKLRKNLAVLKDAKQKFLEEEKIFFLKGLTPGILHQISQPVTAIHGFARFLRKEITAENPFFTPVSLMEEQSQSLKQMLEDLTQVADQGEVTKENINVNELIEESLVFVKDELQIRRIRLDLELTRGIPLVLADRILLRKIFLNLIVNAMQVFDVSPGERVRILKISSLFNPANKQTEVSVSGECVRFVMQWPGLKCG